MRRRNSSSALAIVIAAGLSSCGYLAHGKTEQIQVNSDPPGAQVTVSDGQTGVTPFNVTVERTRTLVFHFSKDGYKSADIVDKSELEKGYYAYMASAIAFPPLLALWLPDVQTGADHEHADPQVTVHLESSAVSRTSSGVPGPPVTTDTSGARPAADSASPAPASGATHYVQASLKYEPAPDPPRVADSKSPPVAVVVFDNRKTAVITTAADQGFGPADNRYVADNDLSHLFRGAFETELKGRGFSDRGEGNLVLAVISYFRADNQAASGPRIIADVGLEITVKRPDGSVAFRHFFVGDSNAWESAHPLSDNSKYTVTKAVEGAMQDGVAKVFTDPAFLDALKT